MLDLKHRLGDVGTDSGNRLHDWLLRNIEGLNSSLIDALICQRSRRPERQWRKLQTAPSNARFLTPELVGISSEETRRAALSGRSSRCGGLNLCGRGVDWRDQRHTALRTLSNWPIAWP
jgi:hypothetical protein